MSGAVKSFGAFLDFVTRVTILAFPNIMIFDNLLMAAMWFCAFFSKDENDTIS